LSLTAKAYCSRSKWHFDKTRFRPTSSFVLEVMQLPEGSVPVFRLLDDPKMGLRLAGLTCCRDKGEIWH